MSGAAPSKLNLHAVAANQKSASKEDIRELRDAVQRRQIVEDMMNLKGTFFPGLDALRQANETPETSETLKARIEELQKKHVEEVRTLYEWHAQDYYDEMLDMSRSKADIDDLGVETFYRTGRSSQDIANSFDDELDRHHYAHLQTILPLVKMRNGLLKQEAAVQKVRDQQFPQSLEQYHQLRKDIKLRIARFLAAPEMTRDRTTQEFGWTYAQVTPLTKAYKNNDNFRTEVQQLLQEVEVRDPRLVKQ
ncbi:hypothetical protein C8Q76DRAFT_782546 [Earliella scabrosa]|nr:hypothetical protein C8Q76DRAFT_782546 [Earliella scabrosa]